MNPPPKRAFQLRMLRFARSLSIAATAITAATCDLDKITTSKTADGVGILGIAGDSLVPLGGFTNLNVVDSKGNKPRVAVVQWISANPSIATVDGVGRVSAVAIGATRITATSRLPEISDPVVNEWSMRVHYASIAITPITDSITSLGATRTLTVSGRNVAGQSVATLQPTAVAFVSRDSTRAAVSSAGILTARKNGFVTVVASIDAGLLKDSILVKIRQVAARLSFGNLVEFVMPSLGRDYSFPVQVFDGRDSVIVSPVIAWSATDTSVATVGATTGAVRGKKVDTTTIVVRSDTARKTIELRVQQVVAAITKSSGDAQGAQVGTTIPVAPVVTIADSGGLAIAGSSVLFAMASGAGTITGASQTTAATGKASVGSWTLGTTAGTQTLTATSSGVATTFTATGVAGPATHLVFLRAPTATPANAAIAPTVQVAIADAYNNIVLTATDSVRIVLASNLGAATLSGTLVATSTNGVATFSDLRLDRTGTGYSIVASHATLGTATSSSFNVFGVPSGLAFAVQPSDVAVAQAINPAMKIAVVDAQGNTVSNVAPTTITLSIGTNAAGGAIAGTITATTQAGVATFGSVSISAGGNGYTLRASATGLTQATSSAFNVFAVGAPTKLGFIAQPQNRQAGSAFSPALQVAIQDANGTTVTSVSRQISVSLDTNPGSATLAGTLTVATVNGVAVFPGLSLDRVGIAYRLRATADGAPLAAAVSSSFNITPASASKLQFLVHPTNALVGSVIAPPVQVTIQDAFGNTATSASNAVSLAITTNPGTGSLGGATTNVTAINGVATFNNLTVSAQGTGYIVTASAAGLTSAASNPFTVAASGAAIKLRFIVQPTSVTAGTAISPSLQVAIQDASGRTVTSSSDSITLGIADPATGVTLSGTGTRTASSGVATFTGISVNIAAATRLVATSRILTVDTSSSFAVSPAAASKLAYVSQPVNTASGATIPSFSVAIQDAFGNTVAGATSRVDVAIDSGSGSLTGSTRATPVNGVATFTDIGIALARTGYQLRALSFDAPLANAVSNSFDIVPGAASKLGFVGSVPSTSVSSTMAQVQVAVQDASGNTVPTATDPVTIAIASGIAGAVLGGATSATALGGIATFSNLSIDKVGASYTLRASAPDRTLAASNSFAVIGAVASVTVSPAGASISGGTQQFTAVAKDASGSTIAGTTFTWASLNPNVATINSSTGVASAVGSGQVTISATVGGVTGYALLTVAIPSATPVNLWAKMSSGTTEPLASVWGSSSTNVFAAGNSGTMLRYDGNSWTAMSPTSRNITAVWGTSGSDVFAVAGPSSCCDLQLLHFNGVLWSEMGRGATDGAMRGIWGSSPVDVYAVGTNSVWGTGLRFDGQAWAAAPVGAAGTLYNIWGSSSSNVYAVGSSTSVLKFDGSNWSAVQTGASQPVSAVWGTSASDVYVTGPGGTVVRFNGSGWSQLATGTTQALGKIWGSSSSDIYVTGENGNMLRYNGSAWLTMATGTTEVLYHVWGAPTGEVYAVGAGGTILSGVRGATVTVTPASPTLAAAGATQQMTATARDASSSVVSAATFTWTSGTPSVATVSASGLATAVANGAASVCATAPGGAQGCTTLTVSPGTLPVVQSRSPTPYLGSSSFISRTATLSALFSQAMAAASATTFVVNSSQRGRWFLGGGYTGAGTTTLLTAPASFLPGEEVEVVLTTGLATSAGSVHLAAPLVTRYRAATTSATASFAPATGSPVNVGTVAFRSALGDVNGDGKLDLVTAGYTGNNVSVMLGNGDGAFGGAATIGVGTNPESVALADVNGDGKLDIVSGNEGTDNLTVLLGVGNGTFTVASTPAVGSQPSFLVVGDLNGDGKHDIVVSNANSSNVTVLLGIGDGTFTAASGSPVTVGSGPSGVALGDLNADGKLDLVVSSSLAGTVTVLLGSGDGTFMAATGSPRAVGTNPSSVELGDVNGDGKLDIVTANNGSNSVAVLLGTGDATFTQAAGSPVAAGAAPVTATLGDVNGDGKLDIVAGNEGSHTVTVLLGNGDGTFTAAAGSPFMMGGSFGPRGVVLGDLNGDGRLDFVGPNYVAGSVSVFLNR